MKPRVAIQGIKASFHEEAAIKQFGTEMETVECKSFKDTCDTMERGDADYVVMAIENTIAGSLLGNYTLIQNYNFYIIGEVVLPIRLHLMALPGTGVENVRKIISHPIAIRQCADYLESNDSWQITESTDTAGCARQIATEELHDTAAIANSLAAELYGLEILERNIQAHKKNYTRFLILQRKPGRTTDINKASLCFEVRHNVGALSTILGTLAANNINLSKIQSMPVIGKPHEYHFYVDIEWSNINDYDNAIKEVLKEARNFNIMGEYKKNDIL